MICSKCGKNNPDDFQFCECCGSALTSASGFSKPADLATENGSGYVRNHTPAYQQNVTPRYSNQPNPGYQPHPGYGYGGTSYCQNCGRPVAPGASICVSCGFSVGTGRNYCRNCGNQIYPGAAICTSCGCAVAGSASMVANGQKSKTTAILLAFFLGSIGIHDFYLGFNNYGIAKILLSLFTLGAGGAIWALVDCVRLLTGSLNADSNGVPLAK